MSILIARAESLSAQANAAGLSVPAAAPTPEPSPLPAIEPAAETTAPGADLPADTPAAAAAAPPPQLEAAPAAASAPAALAPVAPPREVDLQLAAAADVAQRDCLNVAHALVKLSDKELPDYAGVTQDVRAKLLSLELLQNILEQAGPALRSHQRFVTTVIKNQLCHSLLMNGRSQRPLVVRVVLSIIKSLIVRWSENLKDEIGLFFSDIILGILDSNTHSVSQKLSVMHSLEGMCKEPQTLVDIFVNYDCDFGQNNLFEQVG